MAKQIITRSEMARIVGVSAKSITAACNEGRALFAACEGKRINASHPAAVAYIKKHKKRTTHETDRI